MLIELPYNREKAVAYARAWALKRNPRYLDFEKMGGDCTNFASLLAGITIPKAIVLRLGPAYPIYAIFLLPTKGPGPTPPKPTKLTLLLGILSSWATKAGGFTIAL